MVKKLVAGIIATTTIATTVSGNTTWIHVTADKYEKEIEIVDMDDYLAVKGLSNDELVKIITEYYE